MINVTIHPSIRKRKKKHHQALQLKRMKGSCYHNGQHRTSNGHFRSDIEKDEESQQMYGWGSQNFPVATRYFIVTGFQWLFLRYNFASL
jgi:hypothetical protein